MSHLVEDTAFVIAHYRAQDSDFSEDPFAVLWKNEGAATIADNFAKAVSVHEEILHCARNRIIYQFLKKYSTQQPDTLIVNIGAGFSMYPYALPKTITHVEIDLPNVVAFKKEKVQDFSASEKLPERNVQHLCYDITATSELERLKNYLNNLSADRKIIVIEGLFFFLSETEIENLLGFCRKFLSPKDKLICESYNKDIETTEVYGRLLQFFGNDFTLHSDAHGNFTHSFYETLSGFFLLEKSSSYEEAKQRNKIPASISEEEVLNEHIYVLERTS